MHCEQRGASLDDLMTDPSSVDGGRLVHERSSRSTCGLFFLLVLPPST